MLGVATTMSPEKIQAYSAVAQTVIGLLTLIVTVVLTYLLYRGTKAIAAIEYSRSLRDAWITLDSVVLSNDEMLKIADKLMDPKAIDDPIDLRRKKWIAFIVFNILASTFEGHEQEFMKDEDARTAFDRLLMPLIIDDDTFVLTQTRGHPPAFSGHCKKLRENHVTRKALAEQQLNSDSPDRGHES
jgi:hypothetical protein